MNAPCAIDVTDAGMISDTIPEYENVPKPNLVILDSPVNSIIDKDQSIANAYIPIEITFAGMEIERRLETR